VAILSTSHLASPGLPAQQRAFRWSSRRADRSWHAILVAHETDAFAWDAAGRAHTRAALTRDTNPPASRDVASIPMRIWLGRASNGLSFSPNTCHPCLVLAKVIGFTTTLLSGRQMQPAQAWLPMSIPHTYLMVTSSPEEADVVVLIAHLLFLAFTIPVHFVRCKAAPRSARNPTKEARASAHIGSAI